MHKVVHALYAITAGAILGIVVMLFVIFGIACAIEAVLSRFYY